MLKCLSETLFEIDINSLNLFTSLKASFIPIIFGFSDNLPTVDGSISHAVLEGTL